jgi:hypothetical protein
VVVEQQANLGLRRILGIEFCQQSDEIDAGVAGLMGKIIATAMIDGGNRTALVCPCQMCCKREVTAISFGASTEDNAKVSPAT